MTLVVVLDVNILASAATSEHGLPRMVVRAGLRRRFQIVTSSHIRQKLGDTLLKSYFVSRLNEADRERYINLVIRKSVDRDPDETVRGIAPDSEDDLVLGAAVAANADFLVTGDKGLLAIGEYRGVRIVSAAEFLVELDQS